MKKCPSCGRAYSDLVKTCPTCGIDIEARAQTQPVKPVVNQNETDIRRGTAANAKQADNTANKTAGKRANPLYWIAYIAVAAIVGVLVSSMDSYTVGLVMGSLLAGAVLGLIPFLAARSRGKNKLALIAMAVTIAGSFVAGLLLSIPSVIVFTILALKKE